MLRLRYAYFVLFFIALFAANTHVFAQEVQDLKEVQTELEEKQKNLESFEGILLDATLDDQTLFDTRQSVKELRLRAIEIQGLIKPLSASVSADLADIGPQPEEDSGGVEPENIRELREKLNKESLMIKGIVTQAEALSSKATRFLERLAAIRRNQFVEQILENKMSPFNPDLWAEAQRDKDLAVYSVYEGWAGFVSDKTQDEQNIFARSFTISIGLFVVFFFLSLVINTHGLHRKLKSINEPTLTQRLERSGFRILYTLITGFVGLALIFIVIRKHGLIIESNQNFAYYFFVFALFVVYAFTKSWMLVCASAVRKTVGILSITATGLFALDFILLETGRQFGVPVELAIAQSFIVTTIFALILLVFFTVLLRSKDEGKIYLIKRRFFYIGIIIGLFLIFANAMGYVALTRFIFERAILLTNFAFAIAIIRAMLRPLLLWIEKFFYQSSDKEDRLVLFWLSLLLDTLLFALSLPVVAAVIGVEWEGIKLLIFQALFGFKVGGITISLTSLASAIVLFIVLLFLTRTVQKLLRKKVLPKTRMAESVQLSFVQIVGYIGLTIALTSAISSVGFDLSNLALIAGALSVGIGFGLQSIVSNFVSGLILLFERPIKVGDWVILNSGQGVVKKISVRATEIETLDRTSIIIPNSELISSSVKNWTHKDRIGRLIITIGVTYDCDPQRVHDLLLEVAKDNDSVLSSPLPTVHFKDFGDSALIFDLRVFLRNIVDQYAISTKIRLEIWKKLKEENIEIPFPQRDLHIRSADGLNNVIKTK